MIARKFDVIKAERENYGQLAADITAGASVPENETCHYWEIHVRNGRYDDVYIDVLVESINGEPRDPRSKALIAPESRNQNGALNISKGHFRTRCLPHATSVVLAIWADDGQEDAFHFKAEFAVGVAPPLPCHGCDEDAESLHNAYIENLGRTPDSGGNHTYMNQLRANRSMADIINDMRHSMEGRSFRRRWDQRNPSQTYPDEQLPLPREPMLRLGSVWPPKGNLLSGVVLGGPRSHAWKQLYSPSSASFVSVGGVGEGEEATETVHHTASHGLHFEIQARDLPVAIMAIRFCALADYMHGTGAQTSYVRVMAAIEAISDGGVGAPPIKDWAVVGEHVGFVPRFPETITIAIKPLYLAARQKVTISLHSDHPFGVSVALPHISSMHAELSRRRRAATMQPLWHQLYPEWLALALSADKPGVVSDLWLSLLPGSMLGPSPLAPVKPPTPAAFLGSVLYEPLAVNGFDVGVMKFMREHSEWFTRYAHSAFGTGDADGGGSLRVGAGGAASVEETGEDAECFG